MGARSRRGRTEAVSRPNLSVHQLSRAISAAEPRSRREPQSLIRAAVSQTHGRRLRYTDAVTIRIHGTARTNSESCPRQTSDRAHRDDRFHRPVAVARTAQAWLPAARAAAAAQHRAGGGGEG